MAGGAKRQRARIRTSLFPALCLRTDLEVLKRQRKRRSVVMTKKTACIRTHILLQTCFRSINRVLVFLPVSSDVVVDRLVLVLK